MNEFPSIRSMNEFPSMKRLAAYFVLGAGPAAMVLATYTWAQSPEGGERRTSLQVASSEQPARQQSFAQAGRARASSPSSPVPAIGGAASQYTSDWSVGELRSNGLRIKPSGRSDASAVLSLEQFSASNVRQAYAFAQQIPETLNEASLALAEGGSVRLYEKH